jgi:anti-sigma factor RsiW
VARYADGELGAIDRLLMRSHLRACAACAARHRELLALRERLRSEVPRFAAPPGVQARARALLAGARAAAPRPSAPARAGRERWGWLAGGALAGCAATVLAWVMGSAVLTWSAGQDIAAEAVALHTRATLGQHLIEVASSDRHTVKPWLSARLDYSPPVQDLAGEGFPLVGGRIDTLHGQPVATLVYRYRQHTIDVYVWPESRHAERAAPRTLRGFNVAAAQGASMQWLAVSDVGADVLNAFVQRLAGPDQDAQRSAE